MTSMYGTSGEALPCTLIEAGPCVVTQRKQKDKEGYNAIQLAFDEKKEKNTTQPLKGHFKKAQTSPKRKLVEFRCQKDWTLGQEIRVEDVFQEQEQVSVRGVSKGKGFQGVVKRHGFAGVGEASHGQHNRQRAPGSIGGCSYPARVFKGMKMAGRMGGTNTKIKNLKILKIMPQQQLLIVKGAVPGAKNGYLVIEKVPAP